MKTRNFAGYEVTIGQMRFIVTTWSHKPYLRTEEWYANISLSASKGEGHYSIYQTTEGWASEDDARYTAEALLAGALKNLIKEWEEDRIDGCTGARKDGKSSGNVNF